MPTLVYTPEPGGEGEGGGGGEGSRRQSGGMGVHVVVVPCEHLYFVLCTTVSKRNVERSHKMVWNTAQTVLHIHHVATHVCDGCDGFEVERCVEEPSERALRRNVVILRIKQAAPRKVWMKWRYIWQTSGTEFRP